MYGLLSSGLGAEGCKLCDDSASSADVPILRTDGPDVWEVDVETPLSICERLRSGKEEEGCKLCDDSSLSTDVPIPRIDGLDVWKVDADRLLSTYELVSSGREEDICKLLDDSSSGASVGVLIPRIDVLGDALGLLVK